MWVEFFQHVYNRRFEQGFQVDRIDIQLVDVSHECAKLLGPILRRDGLCQRTQGTTQEAETQQDKRGRTFHGTVKVRAKGEPGVTCEP